MPTKPGDADILMAGLAMDLANPDYRDLDHALAMAEAFPLVRTQDTMMLYLPSFVCLFDCLLICYHNVNFIHYCPASHYPSYSTSPHVHSFIHACIHAG